MGYWSEREEEEKGQGKKEEMRFPGLRTNRQLKHATVDKHDPATF